MIVHHQLSQCYVYCTLHSVEYVILGNKDWNWGGCSDNVAFGERISKQYIDDLEIGMDSRAIVNIHNNEAGRQVSTTLVPRIDRMSGI